jgi:crotonobetainyl-CoA:carnitine CoA-transferase CaiB-like acyl-CoA transferase
VSAGETRHGPLAGLRVVDLSPDLIGGQVSQALADFGAETIWIEPPGGSRLRDQPAFPFVARGKRSVVADLHDPAGVARVRDLAATADVLIETFRPGVADRLGLGYEALAIRNRRLVYTSITGFGRLGPWSQLKGYEGVVAALLGINQSFCGMHRGSHPPFVNVPWCSFAASQTALHGVLAALLEREGSGHGQWVEANMAQAVTIHEGATSSWYTHLVTERWPDAFTRVPAVDERGVPMTPFVFRLLVGQTADGRWLQFAQNRPRLFEAFMRALGLEWMLTDPKWKGIPVLDAAELRLDLWTRMLAAVAERDLADWEHVFIDDHDVFAELFREGPTVLNHPQLLHDGLVTEVDNPGLGVVRQPGALCVLRSTPATVDRPAPGLGDAGDASWSETALPVPTARHDETGSAPLAGVTVLELAIQYAAPFATTLLADLGARVIKVEPLGGDPIRGQVPWFPEVGGGKVMQGKDSIAIDLGTAEGQQIVHRLASRVDAVLEGFRDGAAERIRVDAGTLRAINPDLVYLSAHGYGVGGPSGDRPSFAPTFAAACGIAAAHLGGLHSECAELTPDERCVESNILRSATASMYASADGTGALGAASALLLGLLARARGAGGQHVMSSMQLATVHSMANHVVAYPGAPAAPEPGPDLRGPNALYRIYDASDGWVLLAAPQPKEWEALVAALVPYRDLRDDPRFATQESRRANDAALVDELSGVFAARPKDSWQADLTSADVACVAVTTGPPEAVLLSESGGLASGYLVDVQHPVFEVHPRLAPVVRFSRSHVQARAGSLCGDATQVVLTELGYTDDEIADLRARKVVA